MVDQSSLPANCMIRPACSQDQWTIRKLVLAARLDPTQLRWSQFWVVECEGRVIACGQLRSFAGAQELGSLVVARNWRGSGLGSHLTRHLIQQATQPLYLECLGHQLAQFYQRFGFERVAWQELPRSLQRKFGLSNLASRLFRLPVVFMQHSSLNL
ncbi:MAG: GNAT family N-acetyltransferase [Leptolyngbyaceae cyanobacterium RU_5_1]|nr:GNAT family N-acetyltransferase [Leptolyngbyaceae cyanobacterium RU_5_1]